MLKTKVTEDFPESLLFLCPVIAHNVAPTLQLIQRITKISKKLLVAMQVILRYMDFFTLDIL